MMKKITKIIYKNSDIQRIDVFLASYLNLKRSIIQKNIDECHILVNKKIVKKNFKIKLDDIIELKDFKEDYSFVLEKIEKDVKILYEDKYLLVCFKEKGLVTHPGVGEEKDSLVARLINKVGLKNLANNETNRPGIVHRLDKDSEGVLIIAKDNKTADLLKEAFQTRSVKKTYYAVCDGIFKNKKDKINLPIGKDLKNPLKQKVQPSGKVAITEFEVVSEGKDMSLVKINLITGRTHQIRVHMSYLGHPLVGDIKYAPHLKKYQSQGFFLSAKRINFYHPILKKEINVETNFSEDFEKIIKNFKEELL